VVKIDYRNFSNHRKLKKHNLILVVLGKLPSLLKRSQRKQQAIKHIDQYYSDGQASHRKEAEKTIDKAKALFASEFKSYDFVIACLDDECKILPYTDSVKDIAADVQVKRGIDQSLLRGTLASLRIFSYYDNSVPVTVWHSSYEQLFHNLVSIYQLDKSEKIKADIEKVLSIMKEINPSQFSLFENLGLYKY